MRIAFTSTGLDWDSKVDPRFGRTEYLLVFDEEKDMLDSFDNSQIGEVAHGAGPKTAQKLYELSPEVLITGNGPGGNAHRILTTFNLKIYIGAGGMTVREAYNAYKNNQLQLQI